MTEYAGDISESSASQFDLSLRELTVAVRNFAIQREWEQFHTPRNLILALVGEVGELAAEVQWADDSSISELLSDATKRDLLAGEMADVLNYLLRLADVVGVDLSEALLKKLSVNEVRYPADRSRGSSAKYTTYE